MLNKKVLIYIFIFLLIFTFNTRAVTENEKEIAEIRNFIYNVYYNYQYNNYDFVYESMHFEIKEVLKKGKLYKLSN